MLFKSALIVNHWRIVQIRGHQANTAAPAFRTENCLQRAAHHSWVDVDAGPVPDADHTLVHQHSQPVENPAAARLGITDEMGAGGL